MANYSTLISQITTAINTNGQNLITGASLQAVLLQMVSELGQAGYIFGGVVNPGDSPASSDSNLFYVAATAGTYTNFNGATVNGGELAIFTYSGGSWGKNSVTSAATPVVNDLTTGGATSALSAEMGKQIGDSISQLGQEVNGATKVTSFAQVSTRGYFSFWNGNFVDSAGMTYYVIPIQAGHQSIVITPSSTSAAVLSLMGYDSSLYPITAGAGSASLVKNFLSQQDTTGEITINRSDIPSNVSYIAISIRDDWKNLYTITETINGQAQQITAIENSVESIEEDVGNLADQVDKEFSGTSVIASNAFIGGWVITQGGYSVDANSQRVGLGEFPLLAGDRIVLTDYIKCKMYIGWKATDGTTGADGWRTSDFTASKSGIYVVTLEGIPASVLSNTEQLTQYFRVICSESQIVRNAGEIVKSSKVAFGIPSQVAPFYLSFDSTTNTLTIPNDTVGIINGMDGTKDYKAFVTSTLTWDGSESTAVMAVWDKLSKTFKKKSYTEKLSSSEIFIAGIRRAGTDSKITSIFPWSVDGKPYGIKANSEYNILSAIPSGATQKYCNLDLANNVFTIPTDTVIMGEGLSNSYYPLPSEVSIDISPGAVPSSAIKISFNKTAKTFLAQSYYETIPNGSQLFATIRRNNVSPGVGCVVPWSINGKPYGIDVPDAEPVMGFVNGVNHRGWYQGPENTLPAFKLSKKNGFAYVETDIHFTSDDVAVLLHDDTINRTARNDDGTAISETINIADITYAQALTYDFGIAVGASFAGTRIPTLEQFLALCRNIGLNCYLELKVGTQAQIEGVADIVKQYGMDNRVSYISFYPNLLSHAKGADAKARVGYLVSQITNAEVLTLQGLSTGGNDVFFDSSVFADGDISVAKSANIPVEVWTINDLSVLASLPPYVSGVTSDYYNAGRIFYENNME